MGSPDVVIGIVADAKAAEKEIQGFADDLAKDFQTYTDAVLKGSKKTEEGFDKVKKKVKQSSEELRREREEAQKVNQEISKMADIAGVAESTIEQLPDGVYEMGKAAIQAERNLQLVSKEVSKLTRTSGILGSAGLGLFAGGSAALGGMFAAAQKEAARQKDMGVMTKSAREWLDAQKQIEQSMERVSRVALSALLPTIEKVADLTEQASKYVEAHPELAKTLLTAGTVAVGLGAILKVAASGIKIIADLKYVAANAEFDLATMRFEKSVAAYVGASVAGGGGGAVGGLSGLLTGVLKGIGGGLVLALAAAVGAVIGKFFGNFAAKGIYGKDYKDQSLGDAGTTAKRFTAMGITGWTAALEKMGLVAEGSTKKVWQATTSFLGLTDAVEKAGEAASETDKLGFEIMRKLEQENLAAERAYLSKRKDIVRQETAAIKSANATLAKTLRQISDDLSAAVGAIMRSYKAGLAEAAQNYANNVANIEKTGRDEVVRIREDERKQLEELEREHNRTMQKLTLQRDAFAIDQEEQAYNDRKKEIQDSANEAVAQAKENTRRQLEEAKKQYQAELEQRRQAYEEQLSQARAQARAQEEQALEARKEAIAAAKEAAQEQLAEAQKQYEQERRDRVLAANNQIRDLGGALQAERAMRQKYYSIIVSDAQSFMQSYQSAMTPSISGSRASGGYVNKGLYQLHDNEFVMSAATTRAAEQLVGGRLNQQNLLGAIGGGTTQIIQLKLENGMTAMELKSHLENVENSVFQQISNLLGGAVPA
jgi:hypothetical protein